MMIARINSGCRRGIGSIQPSRMTCNEVMFHDAKDGVGVCIYGCINVGRFQLSAA
jgi:hypothetical protein